MILRFHCVQLCYNHRSRESWNFLFPQPSGYLLPVEGPLHACPRLKREPTARVGRLCQYQSYQLRNQEARLYQ